MRNNRTVWHLVLLHLVFFTAGGLLLALDVLATRHTLWLTVVAYNVVLPVSFFRAGERAVVDLWTFLLPVSFFQLLPDWYLVVVQETLVFPTAQAAFPVPLFMAGLWTLPLMMTTAAGIWAEWEWGPRVGYAAALAVGLLVFGGGELALTTLDVWRPQNVAELGGVAYYILPAELLLVAGTLYAYRTVRDASLWRRLVAAPLVALFYLGAATTSYLLVEVSI